MTRSALVPAVLAFASFAVVTAQEPAADLKAMVGKWGVVKAELGGQDFTAAFKTLELQITPAGGYKLVVNGIPDAGTVTLDPAKAPKQMDIVGKEGPNAGKTIKTIYKLDGDSLVVCYELAGGDRPTEFKSKAGTKQFLAEYKRAK